MATVIPPTSNVEAAYEDMFKEITRKLYGEETGNGLHTLGTPVAQVATTGPQAAPEGEQRSFTNLQIDRSTQPTIEYEQGPNNGGAAAGSATSAAAAATAAVIAAATTQTATNVVIQQQPEGSVVVTTTTSTGGNFKSEDQLNTAFGLAALMQQNGFGATGGTILSTQAINKVITTAAGSQQAQQQQQQQQVAGGDQHQQQTWGESGQEQQQQAPTTQIVQWTTTPSGKLQSYSTTTAQSQVQQQQQQASTPKSKNKSRIEHVSPAATNTADVIYSSPATSGNSLSQQQTPPNSGNTSSSSNASSNSSGGSSSSSRKKSHSNQNVHNDSGQPLAQKRYACGHCPYSTDRRDLYTRHENIHKDEKPFQCYACLKQFNRADHVKKHFLRMHREMQYDINKTRRHVPAGSSSGAHHHGGGRSNVTITATQANVNLEQAFLEQQRQPTSSSLSIAETIEAVATAADLPLPQLKQEKNDDGSLVGGQTPSQVKPKREKRFTCCYCPWSGADKWGLKRHLNTHTKPFVCLLCDYKAARSERLATHVLKVHNKRACNKCSFLGDSLEEFQLHLNDVHPTVPTSRNNTSSSSNTNATTNNNSTNNLNVLRTIGNTLGNSNQLNQFQSNNFSVNNVSASNANGSAVTIYTTTAADSQGGNITAGGPLQEIIVNPTSMVGWRLSANGSLIPPHDLLTGGLPNAATQKRGSERLFQYLEAEGSDPEDYARLLKMDAISRNTASVAQDFHKAGGVQELKLPANHQLLFNNKLPSQWTTKEAAALLQSLSNANSLSYVYQQHQQQRSRHSFQPNGSKRQRQDSFEDDDDENTPSGTSSLESSDDSSPLKLDRSKSHKARTAVNGAEQRRNRKNYGQDALSSPTHGYANESSSCSSGSSSSSGNSNSSQHFHDDQENQEQLIRSSPANNKHNSIHYYANSNNNNNNQNNNANNNTTNKIRSSNRNHPNNSNNNQNQSQSQNQNQPHRLDLHNKENNNNATFLTQMEFQNLNKIGTQFQNYVKDIISKYYAADTPAMFPNMPTPTATAQQSQQRRTPQSSPKRRRLLSETEEYIEYLKNKEDITLTITPKASSTSNPAHGKSTVFLKRERDLASDSYRRQPLRKPALTSTPVAPNQSACKKSVSQLATLLPLLADAASQQQYLTAPLDFSKKATKEADSSPRSTKPPTTNDSAAVNVRIKQEPQTPTESQTAEIAYANFPAPSTTPPPPPPPPTMPLPLPRCVDKRSSRKQCRPKKIRATAEVVMTALRDKYLNRMVDQKLSCGDCVRSKHSSMLVFNYHTKASLSLHRLWKHAPKTKTCGKCSTHFRTPVSYMLHLRRGHQQAA